MASLQTPLLAALILLAMILQATEAGPYAANVEDSICCRDYIRHPLPPRVVKYYYWTSDSCRRPGVVLLTMRDREICADPRLPWVKKILHRLNK
ncbi:C-C motif chemokine 22 [Vicugna pacos]|uniref:C-C motif chemokine n=1 Tax=Vicugna pacos TaxID=30538 RepID=A0ABM5DRL4_VICPA